MPDLASILGAIGAALLGGGTGAAVARRKPPPGTLDDHEERLDDHEQRMAHMETRLATMEMSVINAIERMRETGERIWKAIEALTGKVDRIQETMIALDVETRVEREIRRQTDKEIVK